MADSTTTRVEEENVSEEDYSNSDNPFWPFDVPSDDDHLGGNGSDDDDSVSVNGPGDDGSNSENGPDDDDSMDVNDMDVNDQNGEIRSAVSCSENNSEVIDAADSDHYDDSDADIEHDDEDGEEVLQRYRQIMAMRFPSEKAACDFYNKHTKERGFSIRKSRPKKLVSTGEVRVRRFVCSRQGKRDISFYGTDTRQAVLRKKKKCICFLFSCALVLSAVSRSYRFFAS